MQLHTSSACNCYKSVQFVSYKMYRKLRSAESGDSPSLHPNER